MTDWRTEAACAPFDPELFFPLSYGNSHFAAQIRDAKWVCANCPVLAACRAYILNEEGGRGRESRYGIYAGLTPNERYAAHRRALRNRETADVS